MVTTKSLNGSWRVKINGYDEMDIAVPGCIEQVIDNKNMGDEFIMVRRFDVDERDNLCCIRFGAVSYYCEIYLNDVYIGKHEGMWDGFRVNVTDQLKIGENVLMLKITKPGYDEKHRFPNREVLSGFIQDVSTTFGGIWDDVELECAHNAYISSSVVQGDAEGSVQVETEVLQTSMGKPITYTIEILDQNQQCVTKHESTLASNEKTLVNHTKLNIEEGILWNIDDPYLYHYRISIEGEGVYHTVHGRFGLRTIEGQGSTLLLNGKPIYMRGLLHWGYYDDGIIPNPSPKIITEEVNAIKAYGFNAIKHCLYIPREEYLKQADEQGVLLWIELPLWLIENTPELEGRIRREYPRILKQIAGHPSVVMISLGCELDDSVNEHILEEMYDLTKAMSSTLVRDNSGSGECYGGLPVDFADFHDYHFYGDIHNMEHLMETFTPAWRSDRPFLYGEFNEMDTLRDMTEVRKAKGTDKLWWEGTDRNQNPISELKPDFHMGLHDEHMAQYGLRVDYPYLKQLSYNHAMVLRKMNLEFTRSFSQISGYNITSIRDVPIATSGFFDDMGQPKFDVDTVLETNSDVVLLPAWDLSRIWVGSDKVLNSERFNFYSGDSYRLHILCSNYGADTITYPVIRYEILDGDRVILSNELESDAIINRGEVKKIGYIRERLPEVDRPKTYTLKVSMGDTVNRWPIFVYERNEKVEKRIGVYDPAHLFGDYLNDCIEINDEEEVKGSDMVVTSRLTPSIKAYANEGGKVFFVQRGKGNLPAKQGIPFWRESFIQSYDHPILQGMDKSSYMEDLRYFSVSTNSAFDSFAMEGYNVKPILRRYDTRLWNAHDYMKEVSIGKGAIIATTLRLEGGEGKQPYSFGHNVFSKWLYQRVVAYLTGYKAQSMK